jgi:hypothetical protein
MGCKIPSMVSGPRLQERERVDGGGVGRGCPAAIDQHESALPLELERSYEMNAGGATQGSTPENELAIRLVYARNADPAVDELVG